jgi:hypothetical protein
MSPSAGSGQFTRLPRPGVESQSEPGAGDEAALGWKGLSDAADPFVLAHASCCTRELSDTRKLVPKKVTASRTSAQALVHTHLNHHLITITDLFPAC